MSSTAIAPCTASHRAARPPSPAVLQPIPPDHPRRAEVEAFIRHAYARRYGAQVPGFARQLVALQDGPSGCVLAAAGYRDAGEGPLYLEHYLPRPIEAMLAEHAGRAVARERIVEVGHLAAGEAGAGRRLTLELGPYLAAAGFHWAASTLTRELRHLVVRLGIAPIALATADAGRVGPDAALWGRYYEHEPVVLAGNIRAALRSLARRRRPGTLA